MYFLHPNFKINYILIGNITDDISENDIALLKTKEDIEIKIENASYVANEICLPNNNHSNGDYKLGVMLGWGLSVAFNDTSSPDILQKLTHYIVDDPNLCNAYDGQICSTSYSNKNACGGDSGGPLFVYDSKGHAVIIGVILGSALHVPNTDPCLRGITRLSDVLYYKKWINSVIENN